jgi:hypothetical protein
MAERRKHQRFHPRGNCLISHDRLVGTVIDLSLGGLSFSCLSSDSTQSDNFPSGNVEIFCPETKMRVRGLAMEIIDSEKIPGEFLQNFWLRKYRARFDNLRKGQLALLENLIDTTTRQSP